MVTGETPDIPEWVDFEFYDWVWYYNQKKVEIDGSGCRLARWLGVAHQVGTDLCYWLLLESGKIIARTIVQHVVRDDYVNDDIKLEIEKFDCSVDERLSDQNFLADDTGGFYIQDELVVDMQVMRLAFLIAGLNEDLDVLAGDVTNAYLNAKCRETIWFEGGIETDEDRGKKVLIVTHA